MGAACGWIGGGGSGANVSHKVQCANGRASSIDMHMVVVSFFFLYTMLNIWRPLIGIRVSIWSVFK